jgi:hypothetical protein
MNERKKFIEQVHRAQVGPESHANAVSMLKTPSDFLQADAEKRDMLLKSFKLPVLSLDGSGKELRISIKSSISSIVRRNEDASLYLHFDILQEIDIRDILKVDEEPLFHWLISLIEVAYSWKATEKLLHELMKKSLEEESCVFYNSFVTRLTGAYEVLGAMKLKDAGGWNFQVR